MIYELINMNGYGLYVWSSFIFTFVCFISLYTVIKLQLFKEQKKFKKGQNLLALTGKIKMMLLEKLMKRLMN